MTLLIKIFIAIISLFTIKGERTNVEIEKQPGYIKGEFIYSLNNKPTPQCHASTLVETPDGIIVSWFGGTKEKHEDVGIWLSKNTNNTWTTPKEVVNGVKGEKRYPCWNPVLFQPKRTDLMLFYKVGPSPSTWWGEIITSKDNGTTWSKPKMLPKGILGPIKNKPEQLANGTILCPTSSEDDGWKVYFEYSTDMGKTWQKTEPINDGKTFSAIQPSILIHPNGDLQVLCRSKEGVITQSKSTDNGLTWSEMSATSLPNPNSGTDAVTLQDGRHLLVYNHIGKEANEWGGKRSPLNVAISNDGENWKEALILENQQGEYSYPSVIQSKDGFVHITYTYKRETIKYVKLDPTKL